MRIRLLAGLAVLVAACLVPAHLVAQTGGSTTIKAVDTSTGATTNVGDNTNHAVRTNCVSGCSGGTTDTDDASIATGQSTGLSLALDQAYDGSVWRRLTFGTAGTASAQVWTIQGIASMTPVQVSQATGTNLHIVCDSGCSSSTAPADEAAFTAGSTSQSPIGGFFQTTATNNALTNGQMGAWQFTANRAGFVNLRSSTGTEITNTAGAIDINIKSGGSTTVTEGATITAGSGSVAETASVLYGFDGSTNSRLRTRAGLINSADVGLVVRPFAWSDGVNTAPTMDAAARPGFQKVTDGTNTRILDPCESSGATITYISISQTTSGVIKAGTSAKKTYICQVNVVAAAAENIAFVSGTGSVCATGKTAVFGGSTAATGWNFAANGGIAMGNGASSIGATTTNADDLCILQAGAVQISGSIKVAVQ